MQTDSFKRGDFYLHGVCGRCNWVRANINKVAKSQKVFKADLLKPLCSEDSNIVSCLPNITTQLSINELQMLTGRIEFYTYFSEPAEVVSNIDLNECDPSKSGKACNITHPDAYPYKLKEA